MLVFSTAYLALAPDLLVRESARPLSRKSILFATPRSEGASDLSAALVDAGARPLWCPALEHSPLDVDPQSQAARTFERFITPIFAPPKK